MVLVNKMSSEVLQAYVPKVAEPEVNLGPEAGLADPTMLDLSVKKGCGGLVPLYFIINVSQVL